MSMAEKITLQQLEHFLWDAVDIHAGDLAFVQHMIASLNTEGMMGVVVPQAVLYSATRSEKQIRKRIVEDDLLEAVVALPPNRFNGTEIPTCLLIFNKQKAAEHKGRVLFINNELEFAGLDNHTILQQDIDHIVAAFDSYKDEDRYSKVVYLSEIQNNDNNLNIGQYVDTSLPPKTLGPILETVIGLIGLIIINIKPILGLLLLFVILSSIFKTDNSDDNSSTAIPSSNIQGDYNREPYSSYSSSTPNHRDAVSEPYTPYGNSKPNNINDYFSPDEKEVGKRYADEWRQMGIGITDEDATALIRTGKELMDQP